MSDRLVHVARRYGLLFVVALALCLGSLYGLGAAFLTLAGGALLWAILLFWSSIQSLTDEAPMTLEEALSLNAPSAEEEQKQAVLRALKDLEYERSVGKISEEDYQTLSKRYRSDAKALLFAVDRDLAPALKKAEALLGSRLDLQSRAPTTKKKAEAPVTSSVTCEQCQTSNDPDAQFCKRCGASLIEEPT